MNNSEQHIEIGKSRKLRDIKDFIKKENFRTEKLSVVYTFPEFIFRNMKTRLGLINNISKWLAKQDKQ